MFYGSTKRKLQGQCQGQICALLFNLQNEPRYVPCKTASIYATVFKLSAIFLLKHVKTDLKVRDQGQMPPKSKHFQDSPIIHVPTKSHQSVAFHIMHRTDRQTHTRTQNNEHIYSPQKTRRTIITEIKILKKVRKK